jgi:putative ABC transport system permease protein
MNPNLPIVTSRTLEDSVSLGLVPQRIAASVSASLGFAGLLLAATGIYGVTAFTVSRRTREIGVRIALGAERRHVLGMVLRQGLGLIAGGCAVGLSLGAGAGHVLSGFLFGAPPLDPAVFGGAAASSVAVGLAACYGPARRATRVDPILTLRDE